MVEAQKFYIFQTVIYTAKLFVFFRTEIQYVEEYNDIVCTTFSSST